MRILYVTTVDSTLGFFPEHIKMLQKYGHTVELAANLEFPLPKSVAKLECNFHQVDFSRSPFCKENLSAYQQLKKLIFNGHYDIIHTHTPNASAIVRLAARNLRKKGLKVFYTAHGFHFYKGAPLKNWLLFYPVEWLCAHWTDTLITINQEDYMLAQKHMHARQVEYVPGVGLDLSRFENISVDRIAKRRELGIPENAILLLSVGELNINKNHQIVIRALAKLQNPNIHYAIAGVGDQYDNLLELAKRLKLSENFHLLGYRDDVAELYHVSDICCLPSIREGLPVAVLEGMACGLPLIAANNRGVHDLCVNGENGLICRYNSELEFENAILNLVESPDIRKKMGEKNISDVVQYSTENVLPYIKKFYSVS